MPPMPHKSVFEPKDPRIISHYEDVDDEFDDLSLTASSDATPQPRRKMTSTQALVEFLNTTSPEEFQKHTPKRTSNLFFRRRKKTSNNNNPPSSSSLSSSNTPSLLSSYNRPPVPNTIIRKNYIEITPNIHMQRDTSKPTSLARIASRTPSMASSSRHSLPLKPNPSSSDPAPSPAQYQQPQQGPILPSNKSLKKRESSLYSDSVRHSMSTRGYTNSNYPSLRGHPLTRQDTDASLTSKFSAPTNAGPRRMSEHTFGGMVLSPTSPSSSDGFGSITSPRQREELEQRANELAAMNLPSDMDAIEAGLLQRLERFRLSKLDKPSDMVADKLAVEHIRALQASADEQQQLELLVSQETVPHKGRARHVQVQTLPIPPGAAPPTTPAAASASAPAPASVSTASGSDADTQTVTCEQCGHHSGDQQSLIAKLERQLAEEQQERQRLQAALEDTRDHFEVLSGLAYKKLRELWEDRTHWENACIELRDRLLEATQVQSGLPMMDDTLDYGHSEYTAEEPNTK